MSTSPGAQPRTTRHGFVVDVVPEKREEYLRLHAAVWPEVEARISASGISNYTIFITGDTLFAYYEHTGDDLEGDLAAIAADPVTQDWWRLTDPCQRPFAGDGGWHELDEVWHLD